MDKGLIVIMMLLYIALVSYVGYRNRKSSSSEEYFLASRSLPSWLLAITFIASWWGGGSAIDLVDVANEQGISTFWVYGVPVLISTFLLFIFAPAIRRISTISQPQLFEKRYNGASALMLSIFIIIFMLLASVVQVIVVGRLFSSFFGFSYPISAVVGTLLVLFYSMFGGFRGVVLTDLIQFVFFLFSSIFLFVVAYRNSDGFSSLAALAQSEGKIGYTHFMHNFSDNIAYVITFGASWMIQANVWQRVSAARTPKSARNMMVISFILFIPLYLIVTLTGMLSLSQYSTPPQGGVVAAMLLNLKNPAVGAIIFVGLSSAIMSTMDSLLNNGALSMTIDIYKRYISPNSDNKRYVMVGRISTAIIALAAIVIALKVDSVLTISWIGADFLASGAFVPLLLGFVWRRGNAKGALSSMVFGLLFSSYNLVVAMGASLPVAWEIASAKQAIIGIATSLIIYVTLSLSTKPDSEKSQQFFNSLIADK